MKAIDWVAKFENAFNGKGGDVFDLMKEFAESEVGGLIISRTQTSKLGYVRAAVEGAMREVEGKWQAIQNRVPALKTTRISDLLKKISIEPQLRLYALDYLFKKLRNQWPSTTSV